MSMRPPGTDIQQPVLDSMLPLQMLRSRTISQLTTRGDVPGVEWLRGDFEEIRAQVTRLSLASSELLSLTTWVRPIEAYAPIDENNRRFLARGGRMLSLYDLGGVDPSSWPLLSAPDMAYRVSIAPMNLKVLDRQRVVVEGPLLSTGRTALVLRDPAVVAAALRHLRVVRAASRPATEVLSASTDPLTTRQRAVAELLRRTRTDEEVAESLGISLRTVRGEVATIIRVLGAANRFDAGARYAQQCSSDLSAARSPSRPLADGTAGSPPSPGRW